MVGQDPEAIPIKILPKESFRKPNRVCRIDDDHVEILGRLGDIGGAVAIDLKPAKPFLTVDLRSQKLDFDDLGVVFGIPVGAGRGARQRQGDPELHQRRRSFLRYFGGHLAIEGVTP